MTTNHIPPQIIKTFKGEEAENFIFELHDKTQIEAVYFPPIARDDEKSDGFCFSVSVGCVLSQQKNECIMCATGNILEYKRPLSAHEIVSMAEQMVKLKRSNYQTKLRFNFSGEGEPLYNLNAVITSIKLLQDMFGIENTYFFISTVGIASAIPVLAQELIRSINPINVYLQISLHGLNNETRNEFIPINRKFNLEQTGTACKKYVEILRNDPRIQSNKKPLYKKLIRLNFIPLQSNIFKKYNFDSDTLGYDLEHLSKVFPVQECDFQISQWNYVKDIQNLLPVLDEILIEKISETAKQKGFTVKKFFSRGYYDQLGGCGTLAARVNQEGVK